MPAVCLTVKQKAMKEQKKLKRLLVGEMELQGLTHKQVAAELGESRQTFEYRLNNDLLEGWEYLTLIHLLKLTREDLEGVFKL